MIISLLDFSSILSFYPIFFYLHLRVPLARIVLKMLSKGIMITDGKGKRLIFKMFLL